MKGRSEDHESSNVYFRREGLRCLESLRVLVLMKLSFSFNETPWEPPFVEAIQCGMILMPSFRFFEVGWVPR